MHELGIVESWLQSARDVAAGRPVTAVRARVGTLSGADPDALRFAYAAAAPSFLGAPPPPLDIELSPPVLRCRQCNQTFRFDQDGASCPQCASPDAEWLSGLELDLLSIKVNDHV